MESTSEFAVLRAPMPGAKELEVATLGACEVESPLDARGTPFVDESRRILTCSDTVELRPYVESGTMPPALEPAGARERIFFEPARVTAGIVTCGGLCPGLNDVIRSLVMTLTYAYGVQRIVGFCYGYAGLTREPIEPPVELTPRKVEDIHQKGGSLLGSSRGPRTPPRWWRPSSATALTSCSRSGATARCVALTPSSRRSRAASCPSELSGSPRPSTTTSHGRCAASASTRPWRRDARPSRAPTARRAVPGTGWDSSSSWAGTPDSSPRTRASPTRT